MAGRLSVHSPRYTCDDVPKKKNCVSATLAELAAMDMVVTTYAALDKCSAVLPAIAWARVVLDEMQAA